MQNIEDSDKSDAILSSLMFEDLKKDLDLENQLRCLLCDDSFHQEVAFEIFIKHLFEVHNIVIEDVQNIENFQEYVKYWRGRFKEAPIEDIIPCVKIEPNSGSYFFFSPLLKEDSELRHRLNLERVLNVQEFERTDTNYEKDCLFCKTTIKGTRPDYLDHLTWEHNLVLGNPQNLVYMQELIEKLEEKITNLVCIYCNQTFPKYGVLKEHMRKKLHKRINPHNTEYDKFYIVNYLEAKSKQKHFQRDDCDKEESANADEEYSDWNEKEDLIVCLFCDKREGDINVLCLHMEADHDFDFVIATKDLDFYQKIKFINYVRRQNHLKKCLFCDKNCGTLLSRHLLEEEHCKLPKIEVFDQPEFYFPTYENDAFLYLIDDMDD